MLVLRSQHVPLVRVDFEQDSASLAVPGQLGVTNMEARDTPLDVRDASDPQPDVLG